VSGPSQQDLIGCWQLEAADPALDMNEPVEMEFKPDSQLLYCVDTGDRWQVMRLTYRLDGNALVTNQPSHPQEERTVFVIDAAGGLVLDYGGAKARFRRGLKTCPVV